MVTLSPASSLVAREMETFLLPGRISNHLKSAVGLTLNPVSMSKAHDRDERVPWEDDDGRCALGRAGVPWVHGESSGRGVRAGSSPCGSCARSHTRIHG